MITDDEQFFEQLRADAQALRHRPDEVTLARLRSRIAGELQKPGIADVLVAWFRPLTAVLAVIAIAAGIGAATLDRSDDVLQTSSTIEISLAGDTYRVGN